MDPSSTLSATARERVAYLLGETGRSEDELLQDAIEKGLTLLVVDHVLTEYLEGRLTRDETVAKVGERSVDDLDYERACLEKDIAWALHGG